MKHLKLFLVALLGFVLAGCGLLDKKQDPNYAAQLKAYEATIAAKKEVDTEKAKSPRTVQVLSIKGIQGQPMIMSGVSEIAVNLPVDLFEKGLAAEATFDKIAGTMPAPPVEQPSFIEKLTLSIVDRGLAPGIMMWGNVTQAKEATKQAESTNSMWRDIILGVGTQKPVYNITGSYNTGDNQGAGSGNLRNNSNGNYGTGSGDNRGNVDNRVDNSGNERNNSTCRPVPPATTC